MLDSAGSDERKLTFSPMARLPSSLPEAYGCNGFLDHGRACEEQYAIRVGVTVDHIPDGWDGVIKFALNRERQNRDDFSNSKPKKRGVRELHNLCSINYKKSMESKQQGNCSSFWERKRKGELASCK